MFYYKRYIPILCTTVRPLNCLISPGCKPTDVAIPGAAGARPSKRRCCCCLGFARPCADVSDVYLKRLFSNETSDAAAPVSHSPKRREPRASLWRRSGPRPKAKALSFGFLFKPPPSPPPPTPASNCRCVPTSFQTALTQVGNDKSRKKRVPKTGKGLSRRKRNN